MSNNLIRIDVDDTDAMTAFNWLIATTEEVGPPLKLIGEALADSTKKRFETSQAPDGTRWEANSAETVFRFLGKYKSSYKKDGSVSKDGITRALGKKPLIGETRALSTTIGYQVIGNELQVGSDRPYAARQHFGDIGEGGIKSRKFLGVSANDAAEAIDIIRDYLAGDRQ